MIEAQTVPGALRSQVELRPDSLAIDVDGDRRTWAELEADALAAAWRLREGSGVAAGEHVALLMRNSVDWVVWCLAAALCRCPIIPLNTKLGPSELAYQIVHSDSVALITESEGELVDRLSGAVIVDGLISEEFPLLRTIISSGTPSQSWQEDGRTGESRPAVATFEAAQPQDTLIIQYTSGTTAFPKGVMLTHAQVMRNAYGVASRLELGPEDRVCSPNPFFHVAGTTLLLFLGMVSGASVYTFANFEPSRVLDVIETEKITVYNGVESFFLGLGASPAFSKRRLQSIRTGWIAASPDLVRQVHEDLGLDGIVNVYGLSEAAPNVTVSPPSAPAEHRRTCGRPHSGGEIRIVDAEEEVPLPAGEPGLIEVRGPCVMEGYYKDEEATAAVFRPGGWLRTGDRGFIDRDGNLTYLGRAKDMLRVGGENAAPAEIEAVIIRHPSVNEAAVVAQPHETLVEVPVAFVVLKAGEVISPSEITDYVAERLAPFKVPRRVEIIDELPTTGSGKVQKYILLDRLSSDS